MHYRPILGPIHLYLLVIVLPFFLGGSGSRMVENSAAVNMDRLINQVVMISMPRRPAYRLPVLQVPLTLDNPP